MPNNYRTYSDFLSAKFPDCVKVQKIGVTTGYSCPNRDGTIGRGGCAYCNNDSFSPDYTRDSEKGQRIIEMLERGKKFFARKYPMMKYLAYFQSYTNTHGDSPQRLMNLYREAANVDGVVGLVIGTRPDCVPDDLLDLLAEMNSSICPVFLEFGAESTHDATLNAINRCHTWQTTKDAVERCSCRGLTSGLHFIMGLPGETENMMLESVREAVKLPIETLKFHQLQIIRNTRFEKEYAENPDKFELFTPEGYANLCRRIISIVAPSGIAIERFVSQSPDDLLIAPRWGIKNYQFTNMLNNETKG